MRWGIFADIHANYEACSAVLAALDKQKIDRYICLGDLVGYGADPGACIAEIKRLNPLTIVGNHDRAAVGLLDIAYFNPYAKSAALWTSRNISPVEQQFLKDLRLIEQQGQLSFVHASLDHPEQFRYIVDISSAEKTFKLLNTRICFVGHTHAPLTFIAEGKRYTFSKQSRIMLKDQQSYIVNAGSVGQPRDGNPEATFVIYDSEKEEIIFKRVAYDIQRAQDKIIRAGLPRILAERLALGR